MRSAHLRQILGGRYGLDEQFATAVLPEHGQFLHLARRTSPQANRLARSLAIVANLGGILQRIAHSPPEVPVPEIGSTILNAWLTAKSWSEFGNQDFAKSVGCDSNALN